MDPKQILILMFIMKKKNASEKVFKKTPGINYSAANCKIFSANFHAESKTSLFTDAQFSNWYKKILDDALHSVVV